MHLLKLNRIDVSLLKKVLENYWYILHSNTPSKEIRKKVTTQPCFSLLVSTNAVVFTPLSVTAKGCLKRPISPWNAGTKPESKEKGAEERHQ